MVANQQVLIRSFHHVKYIILIVIIELV